MNKHLINAFWDEVAKQSASNRWTSSDILEYERDALSSLFHKGQRVLDLGSGHGELSRSLNSSESELIAVDFVEAYAESFRACNELFLCSQVTDYRPAGLFDIVLLFGVVTYLSEAEELDIYETIRKCLKDTGVALIKNQCAVKDELNFEGFSTDLGREYCSRYPAFESQLKNLQHSFTNVNIIRYPSRFNKWENTFHVLFECTA
jgi:cyclopropane fatty-acyl-phospholipid synthase-like methyltransferase